MTGMTDEEMEKALADDAAQRTNGQDAEVAGEEEVQSTVATSALVESLDIKVAYLAKSVSLAFVDLARRFCALAQEEVKPNVNFSGSPKELKIDMEKSGILLEQATRVVKLAHDLDVLGDKAIIRYQSDPKK